MARVDQLPKKLAKNPLKFDAPQLLTVPDIFPISAMNKLSFSAIGEVYYRLGGTYQGKIMNLSQFYHMLDLVSGWNNAYGPAGFAQHQFLVPQTPSMSSRTSSVDPDQRPLLGTQRLQTVRARQQGAPELSDGGLERGDGLPDESGVNEFLNELDRLAMEFGGRVYTAKDSRVSAENFHKMYPRIDEWIAVRRKAIQMACSPPTWPDV